MNTVLRRLSSTFIRTMATSSSKLRIGYVPEHFSTPLYYAQKHFGLSAELVPFPSGTGHMITSLRSKEIDVGIGLTEGWVAGLGKEDTEGDGGYKIVGTYVETPLCMCWITSIYLLSPNHQCPNFSGSIFRPERENHHTYSCCNCLQ